VFPHAYRFSDGYLDPGDAPGHGVDIDETLAAKFPYSPAYLPVALPKLYVVAVNELLSSGTLKPGTRRGFARAPTIPEQHPPSGTVR